MQKGRVWNVDFRNGSQQRDYGSFGQKPSSNYVVDHAILVRREKMEAGNHILKHCQKYRPVAIFNKGKKYFICHRKVIKQSSDNYLTVIGQSSSVSYWSVIGQ